MIYRRIDGPIIRRAVGGLAGNTDCCCGACVACNPVTEGQTRPDVTVSVEPLVNGTYEYFCDNCPDVFGTWDVPYDAVASDGAACVYTYLIDPAPDPSDNCDDIEWEAACSFYRVRVEVTHIAGDPKTTNIRVQLFAITICGAVEGSLVLGWWEDIVEGWTGTFSIPWSYGNIPGDGTNDFCLPNATLPNATVTLRCVTDPPA